MTRRYRNRGAAQFASRAVAIAAPRASPSLAEAVLRVDQIENPATVANPQSALAMTFSAPTAPAKRRMRWAIELGVLDEAAGRVDHARRGRTLPSGSLTSSKTGPLVLMAGLAASKEIPCGFDLSTR